MKIVGLTGGIACGKSSVTKLLRREHSLPVIDLDAISHAVLRPGTRASRQVLAAFGPGIVQQQYQGDPTDATAPIDRKRLGAIVFADAAKRRQLSGIMRRYIGLGLGRALLEHFFRGTAVVVLDAPLLFRAGLHKICSTAVVVSVDEATQLRRLQARDAAGLADAKQRIAAQPLTLAEKAARADIIIDNRGDKAALASRVRQLVPALRHCSPMQRAATFPAMVVIVALLLVGAGMAPALPGAASPWLALSAGMVGYLAASVPNSEVPRALLRWVVFIAALCTLVPWWLVLGFGTFAAGSVVLPAVLHPTVVPMLPADAPSGDARPVTQSEAGGVLFAGSFNPIHCGHLRMLQHMVRAHPGQTVYACVASNPKKTYRVSAEGRRQLVHAACEAAGLPMANVKAVVVEGIVWRFALRHGVSVMFRGIRTWAKDGRAESFLQLINRLAPIMLEVQLPPPTRFIESPPELVHLSSTKVRLMAANGGSLRGLVPLAIQSRVATLYRQ